MIPISLPDTSASIRGCTSGELLSSSSGTFESRRCILRERRWLIVSCKEPSMVDNF